MANTAGMAHLDRFEIYIWIADAIDDNDLHRYSIEHWFQDLPEVETLAALLEEARRSFSALYPGVEPEDYSVEVRRLRSKDLLPPGSETLHAAG